MKRTQQLRDLSCPHCGKKERNNILLSPPREWSNASWKTQCVHCFDWFVAHILFSVQTTPTTDQIAKADEERKNAENEAREKNGVNQVYKKLFPEGIGDSEKRSDVCEGNGRDTAADTPVLADRGEGLQ